MKHDEQSDSPRTDARTGGVIVLAGLLVLVLAILYFRAGAEADRPAEESRADRSAQTSAPAPDPGPGLPKLLDLGSDSCVPCRMMAPDLEALRNEYEGKLIVEVIDVRKDPAAGQQYGIRAIPTQIFFDASGTELYRHVGYYSKEDILAKWRELGFDFG